MRLLPTETGICLAMLVTAGIALAAEGIELSVKPSTCQPGDLVELKVVMTRSDFAEIELEVPKSDALHLVSRRTGPIRYDGGAYTQEISWVMQPTQAGNIDFSGIKAHVKQGGRVTDIDLPTRSLTVRTYGAGADPLNPMSLPEAAPVTEPLNTWNLLGVAVAVFLALVFFLRRTPEQDPPPSSHDPDLKSIREALDKDESPVPLMERILSGNTIRLSDTLREAMERSVFGGGIDKDELMRLLEKEDSR